MDIIIFQFSKNQVTKISRPELCTHVTYIHRIVLILFVVMIVCTFNRTCVESMLCKVHPELYIPPLTQTTNNAPDLYHFTRLGVLCWFEVEQSRMVVCWLGWTDLLVWCGGGGLIWWADFGGLVWRWSGVGVGAWSDLWSDLRLLRLSGVVVWSEADLMGCYGGLVLWSNLEVWLRKMVWSDGWKLERWEA